MTKQVSTKRPAPSRKSNPGTCKAHKVGGGIGSLAAAAFMVRDAGVPSRNLTIYEAAPVLGGSLDRSGNPADGYTLRGGRLLTTDNYVCTWDLFRTVPYLQSPGKTVFALSPSHLLT